MLNELLLLSGVDIPFPAAQINIHQPTLKEIAFIGEESFFIGCELLKFSKDSLISEDRVNLQNQTNFDIIMSIMKQKSNTSLAMSATGAKMILMLLFPDYTIKLQKDYIALCQDKEVEKIIDGIPQKVIETEEHRIDNKNFEEFKSIVIEMFCLKATSEQEYNPKGDLAQKIADKLRKGAQKRAELKGEQAKAQKIAIYSRYASILAVGLSKDLNSLMQYTVYQLLDEFQRYELKVNYDIYLQAKMAGAKDLKEVDLWMKDIHES